MFAFSAWSLFEQCTIWLATYADSFVVSKFLSAYYLGLYRQPYQLITNIYSVITASVFSILFSALSRFNDDKDEEGYQSTLFSTQKTLALFIVPMGVGIYVYRNFVTDVLLGQHWVEASIVVGIFALEKIVQVVINNPASEIYRSKGKPNLSAAVQIIFLMILIPGCVWGASLNFRTFVFVRASMCIVFAIMHILAIGLKFKINLLNIIPKVKSIVVATFVMGIVGYVWVHHCPSSFLFNVLGIIICVFTYGGMLLVFKDTREFFGKYYKLLIQKLRERA